MNYNLIEAANKETLSEVPKEAFTLEKLLERDEEGWTTFHIAGVTHQLKDIPEEFLTEENLFTTTEQSKSCCYTLAANGLLDNLPKKFLTPQRLLNPKSRREESLMFYHLDNGGKWIELNPRECIPYLDYLKTMGRDLVMPNRECLKKLSHLITKTETLKKLEEIPSLKV